jgi:hypothetical protein
MQEDHDGGVDGTAADGGGRARYSVAVTFDPTNDDGGLSVRYSLANAHDARALANALRDAIVAADAPRPSSAGAGTVTDDDRDGSVTSWLKHYICTSLPPREPRRASQQQPHSENASAGHHSAVVRRQIEAVRLQIDQCVDTSTALSFGGAATSTAAAATDSVASIADSCDLSSLRVTGWHRSIAAERGDDGGGGGYQAGAEEGARGLYALAALRGATGVRRDAGRQRRQRHTTLRRYADFVSLDRTLRRVLPASVSALLSALPPLTRRWRTKLGGGFERLVMMGSGGAGGGGTDISPEALSARCERLLGQLSHCVHERTGIPCAP